MLTKKEKLLTRPWIVKKFENHRRKVQSAGPAIDFRQPPAQPHVTVKLKKIQREKERLNDIERENRRLLQSLGEIMRTRRLDNFWRHPPPRFLNRQPIYPERPKTVPVVKPDEICLYQPKNNSKTAFRCNVCNGNWVQPKKIIPEERVPWEPAKQSMNRKIKNEIPSAHRCCKYCC